MRHTTLISRMTILVAACGALAFAQQPAATAVLSVTGDVTSPLTLTAGDLAKMPRQKVSVTDQDGSKVEYEGVLLRDILKRAGVFPDRLLGKTLSRYVLAQAHDGYQVVFSLGEMAPTFGNESILVADQRDGKPLFGYQGPFRLVCPGDKEGARSVRMLETLQVIQLRK